MIVGRYSGMRRSIHQVKGALITDSTEVANVLSQYLSHVSHRLQFQPFLQYKQILESIPIVFLTDEGSDYNLHFTREEVDKALTRCSNTAAGDGNIHYNMIKYLRAVSTSFLPCFFNRIWTDGFFPTLWALPIVMPFLKTGKNPFL